MKGKYLQFCLGVVAGGVLFSTTATAADYLTARISTQRFYLNGQPVKFEAYEIHGNNFVKLRDIGQAVDFGVTYDGSTNSVHIDPNSHYEQEATTPAQTTPAPSVLTEEVVRAAIESLRERYPHGTVYETPYRPNNPLDRPFDNCDHCAGWAMLCSDAAFGDLPWRRVDNPRWEDIRAGDVIVYKQSMRYNPFKYIRCENDILKLVNCIMENTKGEDTKGGEDFWAKAEALYYQALIAYIWYEAPEEEMNMTTLLDMLNASEVREEDENFKNAVDLMFDQLEQRDPDHFAVRQYRKYKMAAGDICSKQLTNAEYKALRQDMIAYRTAKQNVDKILGLVPEDQEQNREQKPER